MWLWALLLSVTCFQLEYNNLTVHLLGTVVTSPVIRFNDGRHNTVKVEGIPYNTDISFENFLIAYYFLILLIN